MRRTTGERIVYLREKKNWSQLELAERMGMSNSVLSRIEANKRPVRNDEIKKLSELLETSTDYLSCKVDDPSTTKDRLEYNSNNDVAAQYIREVVNKYNVNLEDEEDRLKFEKLVDLFFTEHNRKK